MGACILNLLVRYSYLYFPVAVVFTVILRRIVELCATTPDTDHAVWLDCYRASEVVLPMIFDEEGRCVWFCSICTPRSRLLESLGLDR